MSLVRFTSVTMADTYDVKAGRFVSHVISVDTKGRRWERWDGLGESNGDSLIPSPLEPKRRAKKLYMSSHRARKK